MNIVEARLTEARRHRRQCQKLAKFWRDTLKLPAQYFRLSIASRLHEAEEYEAFAEMWKRTEKQLSAGG